MMFITGTELSYDRIFGGEKPNADHVTIILDTEQRALIRRNLT